MPNQVGRKEDPVWDEFTKIRAEGKCGSYNRAQCKFGKHMFKESATDNVSPLVWWECIAKSINPKTLNLVEQLHTAIASSAGLERLFSTFGLVHSKIRNRLGVEKSAKLVAVFKTLNGEEK